MQLFVVLQSMDSDGEPGQSCPKMSESSKNPRDVLRQSLKEAGCSDNVIAEELEENETDDDDVEDNSEGELIDWEDDQDDGEEIDQNALQDSQEQISFDQFNTFPGTTQQTTPNDLFNPAIHLFCSIRV